MVTCSLSQAFRRCLALLVSAAHDDHERVVGQTGPARVAGGQSTKCDMGRRGLHGRIDREGGVRRSMERRLGRYANVLRKSVATWLAAQMLLGNFSDLDLLTRCFDYIA
jgi:hypothetical protein